MKQMLKLLILPLLLVSCTNKPTTKKSNINNEMLEYVDLCVSVKFEQEHPTCEIIVLYTVQQDIYYLSDLYFRITYDNNIYLNKYVSAVNGDNELIIREVKRQ